MLGSWSIYLLGVAPCAVYARQRHQRTWLRAGRGTLYGVGLFGVNDEIASRLLGVARPQRNYPWQAHLRGLVGPSCSAWLPRPL